MTFLDPMNERFNMWSECGPFVTASDLRAPALSQSYDTVDTMLTDIGPYRSAYAESRRTLRAAATTAPSAPVALFNGAYGPDMVGVRLGMTFAEAEAAVQQHMKIGRVFHRNTAEDAALPAEPSHLPGTGVLFVSAANDEIIGKPMRRLRPRERSRRLGGGCIHRSQSTSISSLGGRRKSMGHLSSGTMQGVCLRGEKVR